MKRHRQRSSRFWRVRVTDVIPRSRPGSRHSWSGSGETDRSVALLEAAGAVTKPSPSQEGDPFTGAVHGWIGVRRRRLVKGLAILGESVEAQRRVGLQAWLPLAFSWLAEGLLLNSKADAARAAAEDGLQVVRRTGVRCWDSELYRLRGEAMMSPKRRAPRAHNPAGDRDAAEASFWAGISVAREQDARTLELRATLSLARLLQDVDVKKKPLERSRL